MRRSLNTSRRGAAVVGALAGLALLSGCVVDSGATDAEPGDAGSEAVGPVTVICGSPEEVCEEVVSRYISETGNEATYVRLSGGEILARLESNKGAPSSEFDVWFGGPADTFAAAVDRDVLAVYKSPVRDTLRPGMMDEDGYWSGIYQNPLGICVNTAVLDRLGVPVPKSWDDLLNPALKQNVATAHPATSGMGYTFLAMILAVNGGDEDATFDWLLKLHPNVLQYTKSGTAPTQMLVRGEVAAIPSFTSTCERESEFLGNADIQMIYPTAGSGYEIGATAVVAGTAHEAAAHAFTDWALGPEALQAQVDVGYGALPAFDSAEADEQLKDIVFVEGLDPRSAGENRVALSERFDREVAPAPAE